jgi:hypothetical protein
MFICGMCKTVTKAHEIQTKIVLERRPKTYPPQPHDNPGGQGWEIVREVGVCKKCVTEFAHSATDNDIAVTATPLVGDMPVYSTKKLGME